MLSGWVLDMVYLPTPRCRWLLTGFKFGSNIIIQRVALAIRVLLNLSGGAHNQVDSRVGILYVQLHTYLK